MDHPSENSEFRASKLVLLSAAEDPPEEPSIDVCQEEDGSGTSEVSLLTNTYPYAKTTSAWPVKWRLKHTVVVLVCLLATVALGYGIYRFVDAGEEGEVTVSSSSEEEQTEGQKSFTLNEVLLHNTVDNCWVIYYDDVYDMTDYAGEHPGGANVMTNLCGADGTSQYELFHSKSLLPTIRRMLLGVVSSNNAGDASDDDTGTNIIERTVTVSELEKHNTAEDCWVVYYDFVFDMTHYAKEHPGGATIVTGLAGKDGTQSFEIFHDEQLLATIKDYKIGRFLLSTYLEQESGAPSPIPIIPDSQRPSIDASLTTAPTLLPSLLPSGAPSLPVAPTPMPTTSLEPTYHACGEKLASCSSDTECCNQKTGCFLPNGSSTGFCLSNPDEGIGALCKCHSDCSYSLNCFIIRGNPFGFCAASTADFGLTSPLAPATAAPTTGSPITSTPPPALWDIIANITRTKAPAIPSPPVAAPTQMPTTPMLDYETEVPTVPWATSVAPMVAVSSISPPQMPFETTTMPAEPDSRTEAPITLSPTTAPYNPSQAPVWLTPSPITLTPAPFQITPAPVIPTRAPLAPVPEPTSSPTQFPTLRSPTEEPTQDPTTLLPTRKPLALPTDEPTNGCNANRFSIEEVSAHDSPEDCWIILHDQVFDFTEYAPTHPGGAAIVTNSAGTDASATYALFHTEALLVIVPNSLVGVLKGSSKDPCS